MAKEKKKAKKEKSHTKSRSGSDKKSYKRDKAHSPSLTPASEEKHKKLDSDQLTSKPSKKAKKEKKKSVEKKLEGRSKVNSIKRERSVKDENNNKETFAPNQKVISIPQPAITVSTKSNEIERSETPEFYKVLTKLYITLPPCYVDDISAGLNDFLNSYLMKYLDALNGIVVAHTATKLLQDKGTILYDSPFINFGITTEFLVWRPSVGSCLCGAIQLQSVAHIALLLHGTFNAVILASDIPKDVYSWVDGSDGVEGEWIDSRTKKPLSETGFLKFYVKSLSTPQDALTVIGTLNPVKV